MENLLSISVIPEKFVKRIETLPAIFRHSVNISIVADDFSKSVVVNRETEKILFEKFPSYEDLDAFRAQILGQPSEKTFAEYPEVKACGFHNIYDCIDNVKELVGDVKNGLDINNPSPERMKCSAYLLYSTCESPKDIISYLESI